MLYRSPITLGTAALATLALLGACSSNDNTTSPPATATVRVVNASSSNSTLGAMSGTTSLASNLSFQNTNATTSCSTINAGQQTINFSGGSGSLGSLNYNFQPGQSYTVVFYGNNNAAVYPETFTAPGASQNGLRFINATNAAGDVWVSAPGATLTGTPTVANLGAGSVSGFNAASAAGGTFGVYPAANTSVRFFNVGSVTNPVGTYTLSSVPANRMGTVVFTNANSANGGATAFLVPTCR